MQDVRDKEFMYEPLLDNVDMETLMDEDNHEINAKTGSRDEPQGVEEEALPKRQGKLAAREKPGTPRELSAC